MPQTHLLIGLVLIRLPSGATGKKKFVLGFFFRLYSTKSCINIMAKVACNNIGLSKGAGANEERRKEKQKVT